MLQDIDMKRHITHRPIARVGSEGGVEEVGVGMV